MEENIMKKLFPKIRDKEEILWDIENDPILKEKYYSWKEDQRDDFINMCTGIRGPKILYDSYFKEIFNPEYDPDRLSDMLSIIMGRKVVVKTILPNDSTRIGDETSLIITDIVVELEDKTIANIEVQRIGYMFPGERASCYSADLLLRQYKRLRDEKKEHFTYKEIAPVYTIVFFENSPTIFKSYPDTYIHRFKTTSDTGIEMNMLQHYIFIPIDIFVKKLHNEGIKSELDAWLAFLGSDEPNDIISLIEIDDKFKKYYEELYEMFLNVGRVMNMFSKELQVLDRNTVKYMIDELQEKVDTTQEELDIAKEELDITKEELDTTKEKLDTTKVELYKAQKELEDANALYSWLAELGRSDDVAKAAKDPKDFQLLYKEYEEFKNKK